MKQNEIPQYSTNIEAAWEIVEKLFTEGWTTNINCSATIKNPKMRYEVRVSKGDVIHWVFSETAPHAICLASLKAAGS